MLQYRYTGDHVSQKSGTLEYCETISLEAMYIVMILIEDLLSYNSTL